MIENDPEHAAPVYTIVDRVSSGLSVATTVLLAGEFMTFDASWTLRKAGQALAGGVETDE